MPFRLVYGHKTMLSVEVMVLSLRIEGQKRLLAKKCELLMYENLDEIDET